MASFSPRSLAGLEIGGARFFHVRRRPDTDVWTVATLPLSGLLKTQSRDLVVGGQNQAAIAFVRVAPVGSGAEAYGEFYREDHNFNSRDLVAEPDHASAYTVGLRRAWSLPAGARAFTLEHVNSRISHVTRIRPQTPIYIHTPLVEGHTHLGQPLGSLTAQGGSGTIAAFEETNGDRSRDLSIEVRTVGHTQEGGTLGGKMSGHYVLRAGIGSVKSGKERYRWIQLRIGFGNLARTNLTLGTRWLR
jgi:hypothetical protein